MEMYGVIDIGSNTIKLVVYRITPDGKLQSMMSKKYMIGLANYVDKDGALTETGIRKAIETLLELQHFLESVRVKELYIFATASFRNIINTEEVVTRIISETGWQIDVLSGEGEAGYGYYGLLQERTAVNGLAVDIGGGSTELSFFREGKLVFARSLPIGSLNLYTRYVSRILPKKGEIENIKKDVRSRLHEIPVPKGVSPVLLFCEGGTARATQKILRAVYEDHVDPDSYERKYLKKFLKAYMEDKKECSKILLKTVPERIHTIIPGMTILKTTASYYGCERLITAAGGVREGYLWCRLNHVEPVMQRAADPEEDPGKRITADND